MAVGFGTYTTAVATASQATGIACNKPASVANGDVLYAIVGGINAASAANWACSGWTHLSVQNTTTGNDRVVSVLRKIITDAAGEPSSYTFAVTGASSAALACMIIRVTGANTATPEDATTTTSASTNDSTPAQVAITTVTANCMVIGAYFLSISSTATNYTVSNLTNYTSIGSVQSPATGTAAKGFIGASYRTGVGTGSQNPGSWAGGTSESTSEFATFHIAVKPPVNATLSPGVVAAPATAQAPVVTGGVRNPTLITQQVVDWTQATQTRDTSSFSCLAGDYLVALVAGENSTGAVPIEATSALTWTKQQESLLSGYSYCAVYTAPVPSDSSQVVTVRRQAALSCHHGGLVLQYRYVDAIGAYNAATNASGTASVSLTTTRDNSTIVAIGTDWNAGATTGYTKDTTTVSPAIDLITPVVDSTHYTVYCEAYTDAGTAATETVGWTAPTGMKSNIVALELKTALTASPQTVGELTIVAAPATAQTPKVIFVVGAPLITNAATVLAPKVNLVVRMSVVAASATVLAPTGVLVPQSLTLGVITSPATALAPQVNLTLKPPLVTAASTTLTPTVTPGAVSTTPGIVTAPATVGTPSVARGTVTTTPGVIAAPATALAPQVDLTLSMSVVTNAPTALSPTITTTYPITVPVVSAPTTALDPTLNLITHTPVVSAPATAQTPLVTIGQGAALDIVSAPANVLTPTITTGAVSVSAPVVSAPATTHALQVNLALAMVVVSGPATVFAPTVLVSQTIGGVPVVSAPATVLTPHISFAQVTTPAQVTAPATVLAPQLDLAFSVPVAPAPVTVLAPLVAVAQAAGLGVVSALAVARTPVVTAGVVTVSTPVVTAPASVLDVDKIHRTLPLGVVNAPATVHAPFLGAGQIIYANLVTAPAQPQAPTVTTGAWSFSVSTVTAPASVLAPQINLTVTTDHPIEAPSMVPDPTITFPPQEITAPTVDAVSVVQSPALNLTVIMGTVIAPAAVHSVRIAGASTVSVFDGIGWVPATFWVWDGGGWAAPSAVRHWDGNVWV